MGNDLSTVSWTGQSWLDSAKMAAMYNLLQTASINEQQLQTINAMNSLEQNLKFFAQQSATADSSANTLNQLTANIASTMHSQIDANLLLQSHASDSLASLLQTANAPEISEPQISTVGVSRIPEMNDNESNCHASKAESSTVSLAAQLILTSTNNSTLENENLLTVTKLLQLSSTQPNCITTESHSNATSEQPPFSSTVPTHETERTTTQLPASNAETLSVDHSVPSTSTTTSNALDLSNNITNFENYDLNDLHEFILDKNPNNQTAVFDKQTTNEMSCSTSSQPNSSQLKLSNSTITQHPIISASSQASENNFTEPDFFSNELEFDLGLANGSFDALKFLREMTVGTEPDYLESVDQAELNPVQFTPPDSPQISQKPEFVELSSSTISLSQHNSNPSSSNITASKFTFDDLEKTMPKLDAMFPTVKSEASKSMPLMFIPPVASTSSIVDSSKSEIKSPNKPVAEHNSLLRKINKIPIYKQQFVNLTNNTSEPKDKDCYSFVDDEFEMSKPTNKTITTKETDSSTRINVATEKVVHNNFSTRRISLREHRDSATNRLPNTGPTWSEEIDSNRPRLVLKFIKPIEFPVVEQANTFVPPVTDVEDKTYKNKRKKHKKKERDNEWEEYPGAIKKRRKEKKHHRHSVDHHNALNSENHSYPTRSSTSSHNECSQHEPSTSSASEMRLHSSSSITSNCSSVSLLNNTFLDGAFTRRYSSFCQTQSDLPKGTFVLSKEEAWSKDCGLWRIDSQNLLQRFVPCDENPGCYRNSSNYTGWCDEIAENYIVIHVEFLKQTRAETIVKPIHPIDSILPAQTFEDASSISCNAVESNAEDGLMEEEQYVNIVDQVIDFLLQNCTESYINDPIVLHGSKYADVTRKFLENNQRCKEHMHLICELRRDVTMLLDHYTTLLEIFNVPNDELDDLDVCLVCGKRTDLQLLGLHSALHYNPQTLELIVGNTNTSFVNSMSLLACQTCAQHLKGYHRAQHGFFLLRKACHNYIIDLALQRPNASGKQLFAMAMKSRDELQDSIDQIVHLWTQYAPSETM
ncbi:hypothetical protein M3Y96_00905600 [Aphelenchoides besseyi]|nr:hypothetical protein M3Y96_00905600 [Aphelenchoides besseyi]